MTSKTLALALAATVAAASAFHSTRRRWVKPARAMPKARPPQPLNSSTLVRWSVWVMQSPDQPRQERAIICPIDQQLDPFSQ